MASSLGLPRGRVELVPYDPAWAHNFDSERTTVERALADPTTEIEHIGSTAIPGLSAKPVIDILVGIQSFATVGEVLTKLLSIGYEDRSRPEEGRHHLAKGPPEKRTHYVHVVAYRSPQWLDKIAFRDYITANLDRRLAYQQLKETLAARHGDERGAYTAAKHAFVAETIALAQASQERRYVALRGRRSTRPVVLPMGLSD